MTTTVLDVALGSIVPSPFNHRKKFTHLEDLAASIKEKGVISPITIRPTPKGRKAYELVVGERRWRASQLAGLPTIASIVRELDDKAVLEIQLIENVQRADVHPLEEADGYRELIEKHKHTWQTLADKTGKPAGYIQSRLKLCDLAAGPRKAFLEDRLQLGVALKLARVPDAKLQEQALLELLGEAEWKAYQGTGVQQGSVEVLDEKGGRRTERVPLSGREAEILLQRKYMLRLDAATFDTTDTTLVKAAGACATCPKRTGNQRELFADVKSADLCTDPTCFETKKLADWKAKAAAAARTGLRVLTEAEAKNVFVTYSGGTETRDDAAYVDPNGALPWDLQTPKRKTWKQLLGKATPATVLAKDGADQARTLWDRKSAIATATKAGAIKEAKAESKARSSSSSSDNDWKRQQAKRQAEAKKRAAVGRLAFAKLAASKVVVDAKFWRWLAAAIVEVLDAEDIRNWMKRHDQDAAGSGHSHAAKVVAFVNKAKDEDLPGMVVELVASFRAIGGMWAGTGYGKNLTSAAAHFKIDLGKLKAEVLAGEKKKPAKKGKK